MPRKKQTKEEILCKAKIARRERYAKIKADPALYALEKEKEKQRYMKRKEQKKILPITELTPRAKKLQRKKWRENFKKHYQKKQMEKKGIQQMKDNTPSSSDAEVEQAGYNEVRLNQNRQNDLQSFDNDNDSIVRLRKQLRKLKYILYKKEQKHKTEIQSLKRKNDAYRKMILRLKKRLQSPNSKAKALLKDTSKVEEAKKKILFADAIKKTLESSYKEQITKKDKRNFSDTFLSNEQIMKDHKILSETNSFRLRKKKENNCKKTDFDKLKADINGFFERDDVSRATAGKKEFITKKKERKQKRYLLESMKNLHKLFETEFGKVSYSYFCKQRPFWVLIPNVNDRDTCACKTHANIQLLILVLNKRKIIKETNINDVINSLCCPKLECLLERCTSCKNKQFDYQEFDNSEPITFQKWENKTSTYVSKGKEQQKRIIAKITLTKLPNEVIHEFEHLIPIFLKHEGTRRWQFHAIKDLKQHLKQNEAIIHIDFSENYALKYETEVQAVHFGGSRQELTLHTAVVYFKDNSYNLTNTSFCTISENMRHDAAAVWAHIVPLIEFVKTSNEKIDTLHFLSDSPSSQYRNKTMFYVISKMYWYFQGLKLITWNYFESAHGKGAADGVGAVLKRTADAAVAQGKDVVSMDGFLDVVNKNTQNIKIATVDEYQIAEKDLLIPTDQLLPLKGTMKVHQVLWQKQSEYLIFREASCFICLTTGCDHTKFVGKLCYKDRVETNNNSQQKNKSDQTHNKSKTTDGGNVSIISKRQTQKKKSEDNQIATIELINGAQMDLEPNENIMTRNESTTIKRKNVVNIIEDVLIKNKNTNSNHVTLLSDIKPDNKKHLMPTLVIGGNKPTNCKTGNNNQFKNLSNTMLKKKIKDGKSHVTLLGDLKQDCRIVDMINDYNLSGSDINLSEQSSLQSNVNDITDLFGDPQSSNAANVIAHKSYNYEMDSDTDSDYNIF